jgi:hypothetical protein
MEALMFEAIIAKVAASVVGSYAKKGVGFLAMIPKPVWEAAAVLGYVLAFVGLHQHYANAQLKAADRAGYQRAKDEDAKAVIEMKKRAAAVEADFARISHEERTRNDQANARIAASADALLVRGPGASSCRPIGHSSAAAAASGPQPAGGAPMDARSAPLSPADGQADLTAVPWSWLVGRGKSCDLDHAEVIAWRSWWPRYVEAYNKLRQPLAQPVK